MNIDIRVNIGFKDHRKRNKLRRILGFGATEYLLDLWLTVAEQCPGGVLKGWEERDIADAAGWPEKKPAGKLVEALIISGFLEKIDGVFCLHNWEKHQSWVIEAPSRSEAARKAAKARWDKTKANLEDENNAESNADSCGPHKSAYAPILSLPNLTLPNHTSNKEGISSSNPNLDNEDVPPWLLLLTQHFNNFNPEKKWIDMIERAWTDINLESMTQEFVSFWKQEPLRGIEAQFVESLDHARKNGRFKNKEDPNKYKRGKYQSCAQR